MSHLTDPRAIEAKSMEIVDKLISCQNLAPGEKEVVKRIVHTTGDPQFSRLVAFCPGAVEDGVAAIRQGASVYADVRMVQAGVNAGVLKNFGGRVNCAIGDSEVVKRARETGLTRAMTAFRSWGGVLAGHIAAVGNAPTALFELLRLYREEGVRPALVVGIPVGFVGAVESKEALITSGLPYITVPGTRGGSTVAVAALNALIYLAAGKR